LRQTLRQGHTIHSKAPVPITLASASGLVAARSEKPLDPLDDDPMFIRPSEHRPFLAEVTGFVCGALDSAGKNYIKPWAKFTRTLRQPEAVRRAAHFNSAQDYVDLDVLFLQESDGFVRVAGFQHAIPAVSEVLGKA
jgi:hypothetical protein